MSQDRGYSTPPSLVEMVFLFWFVFWVVTRLVEQKVTDDSSSTYLHETLLHEKEGIIVQFKIY